MDRSIANFCRAYYMNIGLLQPATPRSHRIHESAATRTRGSH